MYILHMQTKEHIYKGFYLAIRIETIYISNYNTLIYKIIKEKKDPSNLVKQQGKSTKNIAKTNY